MKANLGKLAWGAAGLVVLICAALVFMDLSAPQNTALEELQADSKRIADALSGNSVDPKWEWSKENQPKLVETFQTALRRPGEPLPPTPEAWVFYPRPLRPFVDESQRPNLDGNIVKTPAAMGAPEGLSAKADHGSVYLSFKLPSGDKLRFFHVVRVEVYRGLNKDEIKDLIGTVEIGTEEAAEGEAPVEKAETKTPGATATAEDLNATARSARTSTPDKKDSPTTAEESTPIPDDYKALIVFRDQDVQPKKTYFYKVRLVGRLIKLGPGNTVVAADRKTVYKVEVPESLTPVKPAKAENHASLFASVTSEAASDTAPPNFQVRFAGTNGELPKEGQVLPPGFVPSYQGRFAVQVWVPALREWKEDFATVGVNQELTGSLRYKKAGGGEFEVFEYKTGLKLLEIQDKSERKMEIRKIPVTKKVKNSEGVDEDVPEIDEKTGKPKMKEMQVEREIPNQVAILLDTDTKKQEELFKRADFEKRKEAFLILDRIFKEQEAQAKKEKERVAKVIAANKAAAEKKQQEAQNQANPQPNLGPGFPAEGPGGGAMPPPEGPGGLTRP